MAERFGEPFGTMPVECRQAGARLCARLCARSAIDRAAPFDLPVGRDSNFPMTCDAAPEIVGPVRRRGFHAARLSMKNAHRDRLPEPVVTSEPPVA